MPSFGLKRARSRGRRKGAGKPAPCGILRAGQFSVRGQLKMVAKSNCNSRCQTPRSVHRAGRRLDFDVSSDRPLPWSRTMARHAACSCGQLHLTIEGEPSRNAMCHCLACQRRTGAVISNQARYRNDQVAITGKYTAWQRTADSGNAMTFRFCPTCGSTVFWENAGFPSSALPSATSPTRVSPPRLWRCGRSRAIDGLTCLRISQQSER